MTVGTVRRTSEVGRRAGTTQSREGFTPGGGSEEPVMRNEPAERRSMSYVPRVAEVARDQNIAVVDTRTCESTILTSKQLVRNCGTPCTAPVVTSYRQSHREQV